MHEIATISKSLQNHNLSFLLLMLCMKKTNRTKGDNSSYLKVLVCKARLSVSPASSLAAKLTQRAYI